MAFGGAVALHFRRAGRRAGCRASHARRVSLLC